MREQFEEVMREISRRQEILQAVAQQMMHEDSTALAERLKDDDPAVRLLAVQIAARKRLHLEGDLIELLADRQREVREAARQALVRLSRGTDFGPPPTATPAVAQAARTALRSLSGQDFATAAAWRAWWQKQKDR